MCANVMLHQSIDDYRRRRLLELCFLVRGCHPRGRLRLVPLRHHQATVYVKPAQSLVLLPQNSTSTTIPTILHFHFEIPRHGRDF